MKSRQPGDTQFTELSQSPKTFSVRIEVLSWVNSFVGGSGGGTLEFDEKTEAGETLRDVLRRFSRHYPKLHEALWDPDTIQNPRLGSHIEVAVNDAILDVTHTLDSPLQPGDRILLMGQYLGG